MDVLSILQFVIGASLVIAVHEFGHFLSAKAVGFRVEEFSVGLGATIAKKKIKGTRFKLKCIPLGGYCKIRELNDKYTSESISIRLMNFKRVLVFISGPIANLVFASIIFFTSGNMQGLPVCEVKNETIIQQGISNGYILRHINGHRVFSENDIKHLLTTDGTNVLSFRSSYGTRIDAELMTSESYISDIVFKDDFSSRLKGNFSTLGDQFRLVFSFIREIFTGGNNLFGDFSNIYSTVSGDELPLSYQVTVFSIKTGLLSFAMFYFNLLPFVIFDGFRILRAITLAIRNRQTEKWLHYVITGIGILVSIIMVF